MWTRYSVFFTFIIYLQFQNFAFCFPFDKSLILMGKQREPIHDNAAGLKENANSIAKDEYYTDLNIMFSEMDKNLIDFIKGVISENQVCQNFPNSIGEKEVSFGTETTNPRSVSNKSNSLEEIKLELMDENEPKEEQKRQHWTAGLRPGGKRSNEARENKRQHWTSGLNPGGKRSVDKIQMKGFESVTDDQKIRQNTEMLLCDLFKNVDENNNVRLPDGLVNDLDKWLF